MKTVTIHQAKTTLSQLVADVESGEEIIIMRGKNPVARLVGVGGAVARKFGALAGNVSVTAPFFEPLPDSEMRYWER